MTDSKIDLQQFNLSHRHCQSSTVNKDLSSNTQLRDVKEVWPRTDNNGTKWLVCLKILLQAQPTMCDDPRAWLEALLENYTVELSKDPVKILKQKKKKHKIMKSGHLWFWPDIQKIKAVDICWDPRRFCLVTKHSCVPTLRKLSILIIQVF